jgi:hypothetical protein
MDNIMFVTDWEKAMPAPPKEVLDQCYKVHYKGPKPHLKKRWALNHCDSYVWMDVDFGLDDATYIFYFAKEADKLMFALKCI